MGSRAKGKGCLNAIQLTQESQCYLVSLKEGDGLDLDQRFESQCRRRKKVAMSAWAAGALLLLLAVASASAQDILQNNNFIHDHDAAHKFGCGCMEYWTCVMR